MWCDSKKCRAFVCVFLISSVNARAVSSALRRFFDDWNLLTILDSTMGIVQVVLGLLFMKIILLIVSTSRWHHPYGDHMLHVYAVVFQITQGYTRASVSLSDSVLNNKHEQ